MSGYSIPYASAESIKETVVGYYRASSAGAEVTPEKAADGADVSEDVVKRQKAFLGDIGILTEGESGYALTETGQEIGRALRHDRDDDARGPFGELLRGWEATEKVKDDLGTDYVSEEEVLDSIGFVTDHELETNRAQAGANGLIDLFVWVGILETNAEGEYRVVGGDSETQEPTSPETPDEPEQEEPDEPAAEQPPRDKPNEGEVPRTPENPPNSPSAQFDISLELSGDEEPENVRKLVIAVRKGLAREIDEEEGGSETRSDGGQNPESNEDPSLDSFVDD